MLISKNRLLIAVATTLIVGTIQVSAFAASQLKNASSFYQDMVKNLSAYTVLENLANRKVSALLLAYGADEAIATSWDAFVEPTAIEVPMVLAGFDFGSVNPTKEDVRSVLVSRGAGFSRYAALLAEKSKLATISSYTIESGDTISSIAERFGLKQTSVTLSNDLTTSSKLTVGKVLNIPSIDGVVHKVVKGDTVWDLAVGYKISSSNILEVNGLKEPYTLTIGQTLVIPGATQKPVKKTTTTSTNSSGLTFIYPVSGPLTSKYGARWGTTHQGIDLGVSTGTNVKASATGKVTFAGTNGAYGKLIIIEHNKSTVTYYAHNSSLLVKVGDTVSQGQVIAKSGATGRVTGPHVHFEIRINGKSVNPLNYLK